MKTLSVRNILVPIDFSNMSIQAIEAAKRLALRFGATIHLAHIRQFFYPVGFSAPMPPMIPFSVVDYDREAEGLAMKRLQALATKHRLSATTCHLLTGAPAFDEICRLAKEIPAELIVTPTHGHTGLKHVFMGSTAERIVQHSPCPVFVTRSDKRPQRNGSHSLINRILVPVDFSACSLAGLKYAIQFADSFGASISILHVVDPGPLLTADGYRMYDLEKYHEMARKEATGQMRKFVQLAKFGRVKFETAIVTGMSVQEIIDFAQGHDIDLIITSTHGLTGFKHVLVGSTAERVVRQASCAVLVVPSHPKVRSTNLGPRSEPQIKGRSQKPFRTLNDAKITRRSRRVINHAFPERRKTNKFRETHLI